MILYLNEYKETHENQAKKISKFALLNEFLHEMNPDEVKKLVFENGNRSSGQIVSCMKHYLKWLFDNYQIDTSGLVYSLTQAQSVAENNYVGFTSLTELKQAIARYSQTADDYGDFDGLIVSYYLEWYGVLPKDMITIKLSDVSPDGREIYVPSLDKTFIIDDDIIALKIKEYKNKTTTTKKARVLQIHSYTQDTLYRTAMPVDITEKTIYNIRRKWINITGDVKFAKKRVFYAGAYDRVRQLQESRNDILTSSDADIIIQAIGIKVNIPTFMRDYQSFLLATNKG